MNYSEIVLIIYFYNKKEMVACYNKQLTKNKNLTPFTGTTDPRRQNGRKKGSKNLSTIVCELLDTNMTLTEPIDERMKQYFSNSSTTYAKAVAMAMIIKAINGNVQAATWISNYAEKQSPNETDTGFFSHPMLIFNVVSDRPYPDME